MNTNQTMVKMVLDRWHALVKNFDTALHALSDEQLLKEIAPDKNRGIYVLGHLIAVHDDMVILLNFGDKLFPELNEPFIKSPDKAIAEIPSATELRAYWSKMNDFLNRKMESMKTDEWFEKHTAVSAEDFMNEPHRNKLNIVLTRGSHLSHHIGQFILLK